MIRKIFIVIFIIYNTAFNNYTTCGQAVLESTFRKAARLASKGDTLKLDSLIQKGFNVNTKNEKGWTLLEAAFSGNQYNTLLFLIKKGAKISVVGESEFIILSAIHGYGDLINYAFHNGGQLDIKSSNNVNTVGEQAILMTAKYSANSVSAGETIDYLIKKGVSANCTDQYGNAPLFYHRFNYSVVKALLEGGAECSSKSVNGESILFASCYNLPINNISDTTPISIAKLFLLYGAGINEKNAHGRTPLDTAVLCGHSKLASFLFRNGAKGQIETYTQLLLLKCLDNDTTDITSLIKNGAKINAFLNAESEDNGRTALNIAAANGNVALIRLLLLANADINQRSNSTEDRLCTSITIAIKNKQYEAFKYLVEQHADVSLGDQNYTPPLFYAKNSVYVKELLEHGASAIQINKTGSTPMHGLKDPTSIKMLIGAGASINAKNIDGNTPLHLYATTKSGKSILELIRNGADVNTQNNDGNTPLHLAIVTFNPQIIRLLVENGTKTSSENKNGLTPQEICKQALKSEIFDTRASDKIKEDIYKYLKNVK